MQAAGLAGLAGLAARLTWSGPKVLITTSQLAAVQGVAGRGVSWRGSSAHLERAAAG